MRLRHPVGRDAHLAGGGGGVTDPARYSPARLPQKGDVLRIVDKDVTLTVDDDALATFNLFENVKLDEGDGRTARFIVNVSADAEFGCCINQNGDAIRGTVEKRGAGTLTLRDTTNGKNHYTNFEVREGALVLPSSLQQYKSFFCGDMTVDAGATLILPMAGNLRCQRLIGAGVVTNTVAGTQLQPEYQGNKPGVFSGRLDGPMSYRASGHQLLTGTESTLTGGANSFGYNGGTAGILGFAKLGNKGEPSSLGVAAEVKFSNFDGVSCFRYLGAGETSDKDIVFRPNASYQQPETFDAGASGGLVFTGTWRHMDSLPSQLRLVLTGSNTVPCRILGTFKGYTANGTNYAWYVTKRGTGTWSFEASASGGLRGPLAVEDGTVAFATLAEAGEDSSLGTSSELWADAYGPQATPVDYAFLLGSDAAVGTLSHIGTRAAIATTRAFRLTGWGGRVSADGAALKLGGFSAFGAADTTLTLAGTNGEANNTIWSVSDGAGRVSVVKEGANTWTLAGEQTQTGDLTVREGTLVVRNESARPFAWLRLVVKETAETCPRYAGQVPSYPKRLQFRNMTLLDATGTRQLVGAPLADDDADIPAGAVGCGYERARPHALSVEQDIDGAFKDSSWSSFSCAAAPTFDKPETWQTFVFHLAEGTPEITAFNFMTRFGTGSDYWACTPTAFALEGSADGVHWTKLYAEDAWEVPAGGAWVSGSESTPLALKAPAVSGTVACLANVGQVRVAAGATLRNAGAETTLTKLCIDATGAGTLEGFTFAKAGELSVLNPPAAGLVALPGTFVNVKGLENLAGWTLRFPDGGHAAGYDVEVKDGQVFLRKRGLMVIVK